MADSKTNPEATPLTTSTNVTATTIVPPQNPFLEARNLMEVSGLVMALYGLYAIIEKRSKDRRKEDAEVHKLTHDAVDKELFTIKHDVKNNSQNIMAMATHRNEDVQRIVALELGQRNIEKAMDRIETNLEKNHKETLDTMKGWVEQMSESIREVRNVGPKG